MVDNSADAEDVAQEAFVKLWQAFSKYNHDIKLTTWLYQIVVNLCLDVLKSAHRKRSKVTIAPESATYVSGPATADSLVLTNELSETVEAATADLPPIQKAVFVLRHLEMLSVEETCQALSLNADQVKSNLWVARKCVANKIKSIYSDRKRSSYDV